MTSNDGAFLGINAERALETVLGGKEEPTAEEGMTREQYRAHLATVPRLQDITKRSEWRKEDHGELSWEGNVEVLFYHGKELNLGYGECTDVAARAILDYLDAHPEHAEAPAEAEYNFDSLKDVDAPTSEQIAACKVAPGLYDLMKENGYDLGILDLTGFMWGFAYNTARRLRYEDGAPNPAIFEVGA